MSRRGVNSSLQSSHPTPAGYQIIVHPVGQLDQETDFRFWTEVPALPACMSEGDSVDEAVGNTRTAIGRWLQETDCPSPGELVLHVNLAF